MSYLEKREAIKNEKNINEKQDINTNTKEIEIDTITLVDEILLDELKDDVFFMLPENKFQELKSSIARNGVLSPIIIREKEDGRFQILSGRNRKKACKELGISKVPCIIKRYNDTQAELVAIETNLAQRDNISPVEKGKAYKRQLELLKKMKKENNDLSSDTNELEENVRNGQETSIDILASGSEDSRTNIQRLIRLTNLINELQDKVTNQIISIQAGVELSYIPKNEQILIDNVLNKLASSVTVAQAESLRATCGDMTEQKVIDILTCNPKNKRKEKIDNFTGRIEKPVYNKYKNKFRTDKEFSNLIEKLLEKYFSDVDGNLR